MDRFDEGLIVEDCSMRHRRNLRLHVVGARPKYRPYLRISNTDEGRGDSIWCMDPTAMRSLWLQIGQALGYRRSPKGNRAGRKA